MPNQPKTPLRSVRIDNVLWNAAQEAAAVNGVTVSDVIRWALDGYVSKTMGARPDWKPEGWDPQ